MWSQRIVVVGVVGVLLLGGCSGGEEEAPLPPTVPRDLPEANFNYDYVVAGFCIEQERVIGLEAKLLKNDLPPEESVPLLLEARQIANNTIDDLKRGGRLDMVPAVKRWVRSFSRSISLARQGADGLATLRPAVKALQDVEKAQTCELDND